MSRYTRIAGDVLRNLAASRTQVVQMALGLAVAVAVLSAVVVVGQGTRERVMGEVARHGLDMVMVRAGGEEQVFAPTADRGLASLSEADARAIAEEVPNVVMVSAVQNARGIDVVHQDRAVTTRAFGVEPDWLEIRHWGLAEGEFITGDDMASMARVAILGQGVARELFPDGGAIGQVIRVNNDPYTVKGLFWDLGTDAAGIDDWDDRVVVPFTTSSRRLFARPYLEQIVMRVSSPTAVPETAERVRELLRVRHSIGAGQPDDFFVREPEAIEGAVLETSSTLTWLLLAIAAAAMLAGGAVIMNVMLLAVSQRAHEIGLRRALGARTSDISKQFLIETLAITAVGAVVGLLVGVSLATILGWAGVAATRVTWVPFAIAAAACAVLGLGFGIVPAQRASLVDPAVSLRKQRL
jgi:putative ABC transport system permease protein